MVVVGPSTNISTRTNISRKLEEVGILLVMIKFELPAAAEQYLLPVLYLFSSRLSSQPSTLPTKSIARLSSTDNS